MFTFNSSIKRRQHGALLLEVLVAFLVLSVGMLTVARMQSHLRLDSDVARQRSEAVRLAQHEVESLRAFAALPKSAGVSSYEAIEGGSHTVDSKTGFATNTSYSVTRQIDTEATPHAKAVSVTVRWSDRIGGTQQIRLHSFISGSDPAYSGALDLLRAGAPATGPFGRSALIPAGAKNLGKGRSAFKPNGGGQVAFLIDNSTGMVTGRCDGVVARQSDLTIKDLVDCDTRKGMLLSGAVRFSSRSPADPELANDSPLATAITLTLTGGAYPVQPACWVDDAAAAQAAGADRYLGYTCVVYPMSGGKWSGRATLSPLGWVIGTGAADRRVCRYTTDLDESGFIDANAEHPANYAAVNTSLANQNYLVIKGTESCPAGVTAQHQP